MHRHAAAVVNVVSEFARCLEPGISTPRAEYDEKLLLKTYVVRVRREGYRTGKDTMVSGELQRKAG